MADTQAMTPATMQAAIQTAKEVLQAMAIARTEVGTGPRNKAVSAGPR